MLSEVLLIQYHIRCFLKKIKMKDVILIQKMYRGWITRKTIYYNKIKRGHPVNIELRLYNHSLEDYIVVPHYLLSYFKMIHTRVIKGYFYKKDIEIIKFKRDVYFNLLIYIYIDSFCIEIFRVFYNLHFNKDHDESVEYNSFGLYQIINIRKGCEFFLLQGKTIDWVLDDIYKNFFRHQIKYIKNIFMVDVIDKLELGGFFELSEGKRKLMILNPNFIGISTDFKNREFSDTLLYYLVDLYKTNEDVITNQLTYLRKSIEIPTSPILEHFKILFLH